MADEITALMLDTLEVLKTKPKTREISLAITKLEEALFWWSKRQIEEIN